MGEPPDNARRNEHAVSGSARGSNRAHSEHEQHGDDERMTRDAPSKGRERSGRQHNREGEYRDGESDERFAHSELCAHLGEQSGGEHLGGDAEEDRNRDGDEGEEGKACSRSWRGHETGGPFEEVVDRNAVRGRPRLMRYLLQNRGSEGNSLGR